SKLVEQHYNKDPEKYLQHLRELGLDKKLNIEIPGEQQPYIKNTKDKRFTRYSLPWMSVGYEIQISPLQMLTFYNSVANNGVMMKPYLVQQIQEYGLPLKEFKPEVLNKKICSEKTLQSLRLILKEVVDSGTARNLRNPNYSVAGKTGTAQIADEKHGYATRVYQSSFVGYFPAEQPLYSCIVVVNAPSKGVYYGAAVAAPVFKEIADKVYATDLDVHPSVALLANNELVKPLAKSGYKSDLLYVCKQLGIKSQSKSDNPWVAVESGTDLELTDKKITEQSGIVPDVKGMGLRDALYLLESCGLQVSVTGAGAVLSQSILPGAMVEKGQTISIALSL
ncbi:MAG TPA: penicillin-binding transpeptidase domain-containing protein, partial [Chitinophagales bacterium]|nr:penicillin-binding transpeptidase domain-containing protein [Chitinophagales bacterium]